MINQKILGTVTISPTVMVVFVGTGYTWTFFTGSTYNDCYSPLSFKLI